MDEHQSLSQEEPVCAAWQRTIQAVIGVFLLAGAILAVHYHEPARTDERRTDDLRTDDLKNQVQQLTLQVDLLKQEQAMPAMVLNRYRNSICYIFGVYRVGFLQQKPALRARISGTGFVVSPGLLATNRHVAEPWYGDAESNALMNKGATPQLEKLVAFFPGSSTAVNVTPAALSAYGDVAVLRVDDSQAVEQLRPLPLAGDPPNPGDLVSVVGYPMGVVGMVAKSPQAVYERLAYRRDDIGELIYDAPTAHGASGGPVFNAQGQVIGVNAAFIDGFSGGTLGVSVQALRPLIAAAEKAEPHISNVDPDPSH